MKYFLKIPEMAPIALTETFSTVGVGESHTISIKGKKEGVIFSLKKTEEALTLIPGMATVKVNETRVRGSLPLASCDRISWDGGIASILDERLIAGEPDPAPLPIRCIEGFLSKIENQAPKKWVNLALHELIRISGSENGFVLIEDERQSSWITRACKKGHHADNPKALISSTILERAIKERKPMHIESMIDHPWACQTSIIAAKAFSVACIPLFFGNRVMGVVYLTTHTPGKSIRKEILSDLMGISALMILPLLQGASDASPPAETHSNLLYSENSPMKGVLERLTKLAQSSLNLLVIGETGTGKELLAKEIHERSSRAKGPFVSLNCSAIPPTLVESTLFGHEKGAYTGALKARMGKFQQADGGTLFLDEIGDLPMEIQAKVLRTLQEGEVESIGSEKTKKVDVRIVGATHKNLPQAIDESKFRADLYYRLNGATIDVPPLRHRLEDIELLARKLLSHEARSLEWKASAIEKLKAHPWPGNVRELIQVIQRTAALAEGPTLDAADIELETWTHSNHEIAEGAPLRKAQSDFTKQHIERVLHRVGGVRRKAAAELGVSERTLYRLLDSDKSGSPSVK